MNRRFLYRETEILVRGNHRKEDKIENENKYPCEMILLPSNSTIVPMSLNVACRLIEVDWIDLGPFELGPW